MSQCGLAPEAKPCLKLTLGGMEQGSGEGWGAHTRPPPPSWAANITFFSRLCFTLIACEKMKILVTQSCPVLCDSMDRSLPGFSVHGIIQARILEWVVTPFSRRSSWSRDQTESPALQVDSFTIWASREANSHCLVRLFSNLGPLVPLWPSG